MKSKMNLIWILTLVQIMTACKQQPEPETYLIPHGFKGKVNIIFNQPNGTPVKYENGRRVYVIPENGILLTQFKDEQGVINHEYYYIDTAGVRIQLKIFSGNETDVANDIGVFRDGTVGVYGNSNDPKSLSYQEFYITDGSEFENYFKPEYQKRFNALVKQLTGYDF